MFFIHIVTGLLVSSITIGVIMLIKRLLSKHISAQWQYNLWFLLLIALTLPFIPKNFIQLDSVFIPFDIHSSEKMSSPLNNTTENSKLSQENWMQDLTVSVDRLNMDVLNTTLEVIWIAGMFVMSVLFLHAWFNLKKIKDTTTNLSNEDVLQLFERCKYRLNIKKPLILGESPLVQSPMTFGLFKTYVVLPVKLDGWMSNNQITYMFMHELHHYKCKDIPINYLMMLFQIVYWLNPLVWVAFKHMRIEREIACDIAVLKELNERDYEDYGNTIIHVAGRVSHSKNVAWTPQFNGPKKQIKKRIEKIASFTIESKWVKLKSISIFIFAGVMVASQMLFISAMAIGDNRHHFNDERTQYEDLSEYFTGYDGSIVLFDRKRNHYTIYNKDKSTLRVSPNSTYKIYLALLGLETGGITRDHSAMKWNGTTYPYESWNKDQNLATVMEHSVTWYFKELDKLIPQDINQAYLKQIGYGNADFSGGPDYWLQSSLKISPVEQVQLLLAFHTNTFGFNDQNIQTVKDSLLLEENNGARLYGKTGTGNVNGSDVNGWFIGYVETSMNTHFFATNIENENDAAGSKAAEITLSLLRDKGIIVE